MDLAQEYESQEAAREARRNEVGTEPMCPLCGVPRVSRTNYIRCNPCATNWLNEEMHLPNYLSLDPRVARREAARMAGVTRPIAEPQAADAK